MNIRLEDLTIDNYRQVLTLKVHPEQEPFVMSNCCSVAQSKFVPGCFPRAIYRDDEPVGFLMYVLREADNECSVQRLMVDRRWQREGIGGRALELAVAEIRERFPAARLTICYEPENTVARGMYSRFGFIETGVDDDGEIIAELPA